MKQLPGRVRPRWITVLLQGAAAVVTTIWLASLLPYLLLMALVVSLMLIPTLRRLRKEAEQTVASSWAAACSPPSCGCSARGTPLIFAARRA